MIRSALVTGASSGIGRALCELLTAKGIACCLVARRWPVLRRLTEQLPGSTFLVADLSTKAGIERVVRRLRCDPPDLVVNNAGFGLYGPALSHTTDEHLEILNVNGSAVVELTLEAARAFCSAHRSGVILNVASAGAFVPMPENTSYGAAKALAMRFSQSLDIELRPQGIRVLCSCPGEVVSGFRERASKGAVQEKRSRWVLSSEESARLIWKQIQKGQPVRIVDWKTRLGIGLARLVPATLVGRAIQRRLNRRHER